MNLYSRERRKFHFNSGITLAQRGIKGIAPVFFKLKYYCKKVPFIRCCPIGFEIQTWSPSDPILNTNVYASLYISSQSFQKVETSKVIIQHYNTALNDFSDTFRYISCKQVSLLDQRYFCVLPTYHHPILAMQKCDYTKIPARNRWMLADGVALQLYILPQSKINIEGK